MNPVGYYRVNVSINAFIKELFVSLLQVMSYSLFIFEQASVPKDTIPYVIVGQGAINVLATIVAVSTCLSVYCNRI